MGDHGLALAAQSVDQKPDARGILRIGALDLVDLGVNEGFEFDGAGKGAFDAFAHGRNLAANGLADHHHPVLGEIFRLGETKCHFGHGLCGNPHFLGAANHRGESPEQDDRQECSDGEHDPFGSRDHLLDGTGFPDNRPEKLVGKEHGSAKPDQRQHGSDPKDCGRRTPVDALQHRAEVLLAIVVGRSKRCRLGSDRTFDGTQLRRRSGRGLPVAAFANQFVGCLRYLSFQIVHRGGHIHVAARRTGQIEIKRVFEFPGNVAVDVPAGRRFLRHAAVTLYSRCAMPLPPLHTRLNMDPPYRTDTYW